MKKAVLLLGLVLFFPALGRAELSHDFWRTFEWTTSDGVRMEGLYHGASRSGAYAWVLLHGLGSNRGEWDEFCRKLAAQGEGALIYDARGHGESVHGAGGKTLDYKEWRDAGAGSAWRAMTSDLESAVRTLSQREGIPIAHIAVGGASLGANVALAYAAGHRDVPALVLLSPGFQYAGIESEKAFRKYEPRPVFIAASPGDSYAFATVQHLASLRGDSACRVAAGEGAEHGVHMLEDSFTAELLAWMKEAPSWK